MDHLVKQALKKWPNVPHCYGWLGLSARGEWCMRDELAQAQGPFCLVKGSRITHPALCEFIGRNYDVDADGCWYFQNGPQRVYVELEAAPWVWRLNSVSPTQPPRIVSHTGRPAEIEMAWMDDGGRVFLSTDLGLGLVHTLDTALVADAIDTGTWQPPQTCSFHDLVLKYGYQLTPTIRQASSVQG